MKVEVIKDLRFLKRDENDQLVCREDQVIKKGQVVNLEGSSVDDTISFEFNGQTLFFLASEIKDSYVFLQ